MPATTPRMTNNAMSVLKKHCSQSAGLGPSSYAPIAQAFNKLLDVEREQLRVSLTLRIL